MTTESLETFALRMQLVGLVDPGFWTRFGVHYGLFLGVRLLALLPDLQRAAPTDILFLHPPSQAVRGGATTSQFNYWVDKGILGLNGVIGCFGMTEVRATAASFPCCAPQDLPLTA